MEIYLDIASTTKLDDNVMQIMNQSYQEDFANPSSLHHAGYTVSQKIEAARKSVADLLHISSGELIFTSGGSESNNLAILGTHGWRFGRQQWVHSAIEHPSVMSPYNFLKKNGEIVHQIPCHKNGLIDMAALESMINQETAMVSLMHVNNETGIIQPVEEAAKLICERNSRALIHVDGIQAIGKMTVDVSTLKVDYYSISSHKFNGPRGVGALFVRHPQKMTSMIMGGGQEKGHRAGTENSAGIAGMQAALKQKLTGLDEKIKAIRESRNHIVDLLQTSLDEMYVVEASEEAQVPGILQICMAGTKSEVMLRMLSEEGIYVSAGSACSSRKQGSHVLKAMKIPDSLIDGALRISFDEHLTHKEIDYLTDRLVVSTKKMRKFVKR